MARRRCRIDGYKQSKLLEMFVAVVPARTAAELATVNRHSATLFYHKIRNMIACELEDESPFDGEVEVDESYFGGQRKGNRGRGAAGKVPVFGLLKRGGKVYTKVIADASSATLIPIIERKVLPDSIVYSDSWTAYNALDVSDFHHQRINHSIEYVDGGNRRNHINGIENFWNQAKRHLRKYNGIPKEHFPLFLKECEFRFNFGSATEQLNTLKKWKRKHLI
jgi:transposase